jgi:hypothetical protein
LRQEDKEVDGPDLEHAEERKRETELVEEKEDALYDLDGLPETTVDGKRAADVIAAMKGILAGDRIVINDLALPKRQLTALEALKSAVEGKDKDLSRFVYAEDRRTLLEQALAVLQPELATIQGANSQFEELIAQVGTLREKLNVLEDSEEELVEGRFHDQAKDGSDTDDKDDTDDDTKPKPKGAKKKPKAPPQSAEDMALEGPERPEPAKGPSTLTTGPARPEPAKGPTTLESPERPVPAKGPTTLGDAAEIAKAADATAPRWRRSDG